MHLLDGETGAVRWRRRGRWARGDARGVLITRQTPRPAVEACTLDGEVRWTHEGMDVSLVGAEHALLERYQDAHMYYAFVDRDTGEVAGRFDRPNGVRRGCVVRGGALFVDGGRDGGLEAVGVGGDLRWKIDLKPLSRSTPIAVLPLHGRVLVYFDDMTFVCFA